MPRGILHGNEKEIVRIMRRGSYSPYIVSKFLGVHKSTMYYHCEKYGYSYKDSVSIVTKRRAEGLYAVLGALTGIVLQPFELVWTKHLKKRGPPAPRRRVSVDEVFGKSMYAEYIMKNKNISKTEKRKILDNYNKHKHETQDVVYTQHSGSNSESYIINSKNKLCHTTTRQLT